MTERDGSGLVDSQSAQITSALLTYAGKMLAECNAAALFVYADALPDPQWKPFDGLVQKIFYVTKTAAEASEQEHVGHNVIRVPDVPMTRIGQIKMAILLALSQGMLSPEDTVVCLSGIAESASLDTLMVMRVGREFEIFSAPSGSEAASPSFRPEVLARVIEIASELGVEGREGKSVGALFVVGDLEKVLPLTRQLVLNPFHGYSSQLRNLLNPSLEDTIKEYSALDGAFLINGDGIVEAAGAFLKTSGGADVELPQGLGARHHAAAAITSVTNCIAVTVSESTGTVTIFRIGKIVTAVEKPRSLERASSGEQPPG